MNYTMITNHAHTGTPPPPLENQNSKRYIGFVAASAEISKTINMLSKHGTANVIIS